METVRSRSIARQKWNSEQKWDSAVSTRSNTFLGAPILSEQKWDSTGSTRSKTPQVASILTGRQFSTTDTFRYSRSGELTSSSRAKTSFLKAELSLKLRPHSNFSSATRGTVTTPDEPRAQSSVTRGEVLPDRRVRSTVERYVSNLNAASDKASRRVEEQVGPVTAAISNDCSTDNSKCPSGAPLTTSVQTQTEGSHSRLLSRGEKSSSSKWKQLSTSSKLDRASFKRETASSSFRKTQYSARRKAARSSQDREEPSIASESTRSTHSFRYSQTPDLSNGTEIFKSPVLLQSEEPPGQARTIAAAAEMALARKIVRDKLLSKTSAVTPWTGMENSGVSSSTCQPSLTGAVCNEKLQPPLAVLPVPVLKKMSMSQEIFRPQQPSHDNQLNEDLDAAVARPNTEDVALSKKVEVEDDTKSVLSDYCPEQAQIDLVAPAAAKILNREDDKPFLTPRETPIAVPFKWEDAPGKPKDCVATSLPCLEPPHLSLPPRLLGGCHNPTKQQYSKILQTYSGNLLEMDWNASGNPTPITRSREATPSKRDLPPPSRDPTPTSIYFPARATTKSGPITFASISSAERVRENFSGPLRSNTGPNYLSNIALASISSAERVRENFSGPLRSNTGPNYLSNIVPCRSVSQELARVSQEIGRASEPISEAGSDLLHDFRQFSAKNMTMSPELEVIHIDPLPLFGDNSPQVGKESVEPECKLSTKTTAVDPLSPTSILVGPELCSQRSTSNLSSACADSLHSLCPETYSTAHSKSESCTSLESFADESYNVLSPWSRPRTIQSSASFKIGPTYYTEPMQGNTSIEDGVKAIFKFCRKARKWILVPKIGSKKDSVEPDIWAPTLTSYFQNLEISGSMFTKVTSQVVPEAKELEVMNHLGLLSGPFSPFKINSTSDRLGPRKVVGAMTPVQIIANNRSPSYQVLATDECFSLFSMGKVWNGTKARQVKWGLKMRRSSRLIAAVFTALKRSMWMRCGKQSISIIPADKMLSELTFKEQPTRFQRDLLQSLSANHQFHRPL